MKEKYPSGPEAFDTIPKGEAFHIHNSMGGVWSVTYRGRTPDGRFKFQRKATRDWPAETFLYSSADVARKVFWLVPDWT